MDQFTRKRLILSQFCALGYCGVTIMSTEAFVPTPLVRFPESKLQMSIPNSVDTLTSGLSSIARLPFGTIVTPVSPTLDIPQIVALYDMEGSTDCRLVRERISELDLCVDLIIPVAPGSRATTDESFDFFVGEGKDIPRMIVEDKERGTLVYEGATDVLEYLSDQFGPRPPIVDESEEALKKIVVEGLVNILQPLPSLLRFGRGSSISGCRSSLRPSEPLVIYSYEGNQFCRLVREVLSELDISYKLRSAGKGSVRREELSAISGSTQCPFLIDPNTGTQISESKEIVKYLYKNYATYTPPSRLLGAASQIVITPLLKPIYKVLAPLQAGSNREDKESYEREIASAKAEIKEEIVQNNVVVYTYTLSPFCTEAIAVLDSLPDIEYKVISLGLEWLPFLINENGSQKRAALGSMTGQTSLPHVFVNGESIGGLYDGLIPALEDGRFSASLKNCESYK